MKIGVISDTHNFFDPKIPRLFAGVEHILHAGDIGSAFIKHQLDQIAPVTAVAGNTDSMLVFNETEVFELGRRKFLLQHIVDPRTPVELLQHRIIHEKPDVVVFGHTHKPFNEMIHGILYFNPGYAGDTRPGIERTIAILHFVRHEIRPEFLPL
jgi:uncharacterized protein